MTEINNEDAPTEEPRPRLTAEAVRQKIDVAIAKADRHDGIRGHALWCAAMTYAEVGDRCNTPDILDRADAFLAWLYAGRASTEFIGPTA